MAGATRELTIILLCDPNARESIIRARACLRYTDPSYEIILVAGDVPVKEATDLTAFARNHPGRVTALAYAEHLPDRTLYARAAKKAAGTVLMFCDRKVQFYAHSRLLLKAMLERGTQRDVGAVGCLILEQNKQHIFSAGLAKPAGQPFRRIYGGHLLKRAIRFLGTRTYPYDIRKSRPVIAVSGAMLISRASFRTLGGFTNLPAANAAQLMVDLCLRANRTGRQTWYSATGSLLVQAGTEPNLQLTGQDEIFDDLSSAAPDNRRRPKPPKPLPKLPKLPRLPRIKLPRLVPRPRLKKRKD